MAAPKNIYLGRNIASELDKRGHTTQMYVRKWPINQQIAKELGIQCRFYGIVRKGVFGKAMEMAWNDFSGFREISKFKPDVIVGDSLLGHVAKALHVPSIAFTDGNLAGYWRWIYQHMYFSDVFVTPSWNLIGYKRKVVRYNGLQEVGYLSPKYFKPDKAILTELNLREGEPFALLRVSALEMSHDIGLKGMSKETLRLLVHYLSPRLRVLISTEKRLDSDLNEYVIHPRPSMMHHLVNFATLLVAESAMAVEGGLLGVPSIQVSPVDSKGLPFFARQANFRVCSENGLTRMKRSDSPDSILDSLKVIMNNEHAYRARQMELARQFIEKSADVVQLGADVVEASRQDWTSNSVSEAQVRLPHSQMA